jgi:hypothetical protein
VQKDQQASFDDMTSADVKTGNEGFLLWRR